MSNAVSNTGRGYSLVYQAGIPLEDMEFVQLYPTSHYGTNVFTESALASKRGIFLILRGDIKEPARGERDIFPMPGGLLMIIKEKIFSLVGKKEMNSLLKNSITESPPRKQDSKRF